MKLGVICTLCFVFTASAVAQDSSSTFEQRMYDIYKSSYDKEVTDEQWALYVSNLSQRTYTINEGDTLWDLSTIFFGDGFFWPKIWSYNSTLTNPHLLTVGQKIHFFTGSLDLPPGVNVDSKETITEGSLSGFVAVKKSAVTSSNVVPPKSLYPGAPTIPLRQREIRPVLESIPSTFENSDSYDVSKYDDKGVSMDIRPPVRVNPLFVAHSFLYGGKAQDYPNIGRLVESEDNVLLVGQNQQVYIRSSEGLSIGEHFTVMGKDYEFDRNGFDGNVIRYMGTVEITENVDNDLYRGIIIQSLSGVKGSPWITREKIPSFSDDYVGRANNVNVRIIGGGLDNFSRVFGQSDVIYLGGGTNKGLRAGDILGIYKRRDIRYDDSTIEKSPTPIAHIKVFRSEPKLASAFVLSSSDVILPGDETGMPTLVQSSQAVQDNLNSIESDLDSQAIQKAEFEDDDIVFK